jgi:hypothetical protein
MPVDQDIELIIENEYVIFEWNDKEIIQPMAEELGETEFPAPRPCG